MTNKLSFDIQTVRISMSSSVCRKETEIHISFPGSWDPGLVAAEFSTGIVSAYKIHSFYSVIYSQS